MGLHFRGEPERIVYVHACLCMFMHIQWDPCNQDTLGQSFCVLIIEVSLFQWLDAGRNSAAILGGKQNLSSCMCSRAFIVELNLKFLRDMN